MRYSDEIIAIVPARSGSISVKDKNVKDLKGFPLMAYSIAAAKMCKAISRVIVSTDSEEYARIARKYGAIVPFLRPTEISCSDSEDIEYLKHTLMELQRMEGCVPKYIVLLRPTTPVRNPLIIQEAIDKMQASEYTAITSVIKNNECPYKWVRVNDNGEISPLFSEMRVDEINKPRQNFPPTFFPDGYVEILRAKKIIEENEMYGEHALAIEVKETVDIDTEIDFEKAKDIIEKTSVYNYLYNIYKK